MAKFYKHYYFNPLVDDFANTNINGQRTPKNYSYLPKNIIYRFFKPLVYYLVLPIVSLIELFILKGTIKNRKVLKKIKGYKKGYFIYGNHTSKISDAFSAPSLAFPRQCYVIANPDVISIKGIVTLVKLLGVLPVPSSKETYCSFLRCIERLYNTGKVISIYPEAHIWPKYNEIREFPRTSFLYPVKLNAPCFCKTTVYKKRKNGTTKPVIFLDGPFYPNKDLSLKEAQEDLKNRIYQQMVKRTQKEHSSLDCHYAYIKVASPNQVRTEIIKK